MLPNSSQQLNPQESHTIFIQRSNQCTDPTIRVYYCTVYQGEPIFCINKKAFSRLFSCYVASSPKGDHFKHKKKCIQKNPTSLIFVKFQFFLKISNLMRAGPKSKKDLGKASAFFRCQNSCTKYKFGPPYFLYPRISDPEINYQHSSTIPIQDPPPSLANPYL